jgi:eukaryotic-like serine/threonine-protein kinase
MTSPTPPGEEAGGPRPGSLVGHYRILGEIGRGGMGVVHRALDVNLEREVALKCPRQDLAADVKLVRRFLHEAKAVSRISHPAIIPVFEVFEDRGHPWLASELVEGENLGAAMKRRGPLPVEEVLAHAAGLTDALNAAHAKGVLHRDIKPGNVLIGNDGRARLADFGLAGVLASDAEDMTTRSASLTGSGHVVGTAGYMSPEQVLGKPLDARSDLFSLGAVLYEMCTARPAFVVPGRDDWVDALLHREPSAISRYNYDVPEELERIIRKAMAKRPDERYQHASEMHADVLALRRKIESGSYSREVLRPRRRRLLAWTAVPAAAVLLGLLVLAAIRGHGPVLSRTLDPSAIRTRQLTGGAGWQKDPALSPDGSLVAYCSSESGNPDIWIMGTHGGSALRLTDDSAPDEHPAWFPDGSHLAFTSGRHGQTAVWKVPLLGGAPVLLVPEAEGPAISPDGRRIAFSRPSASTRLRIFVGDLSDPSNAVALTGDGDGLFDHENPAWSPDGKTICYQDFRDLWLVPSSGGAARRLTSDHTSSMNCQWSADGRRIYFSSLRDGTSFLWRIPATGGTPERVTAGTGTERQPSLSGNGSLLASSTYLSSSEIELTDIATGEQTVLPSNQIQYVGPPALGPSGNSIVYASDREGPADLWIQDLAGIRPVGAPRKLTDHPGTVGTEALSPDGKWVAYFRVLAGQRDIWIVPSAGGLPRRFTDDPGIDMHPAWSPDGRSLAFSSDRDGVQHIWIAPVADGSPSGPARQLTSGRRADYLPAWSPDGKRIAFVGEERGASGLLVVPVDRSSPPLSLTRGALVTIARWEPSGKSLLASASWNQGPVEVRRVVLDGGRVVPLEKEVSFGARRADGFFDLSPNGKILALLRENERGSLWLLEAPPGSF